MRAIAADCASFNGKDPVAGWVLLGVRPETTGRKLPNRRTSSRRKTSPHQHSSRIGRTSAWTGVEYVDVLVVPAAEGRATSPLTCETREPFCGWEMCQIEEKRFPLRRIMSLLRVWVPRRTRGYSHPRKSNTQAPSSQSFTTWSALDDAPL